MKLAYLAFTDTGEALANELAQALGGAVSRCRRPLSLDEWTKSNFAAADGLIFVGAAGIAVRASAPYVRDKTHDPAVVVVDECGAFAVPLLSGHLGGANALARRIAAVCGAQAVITTATDRHGVFAVDEWTKRQRAEIQNPNRIKCVSGKVLRGEPISVYSAWTMDGDTPDGVVMGNDPNSCDVRLDWHTGEGETLCAVPHVIVLGIGCRKDTSQEDIERQFAALCERTGLCERAVCAVASIDRKQNEPGLRAFCAAHGWPFVTFSAEQLMQVSGAFTPSPFVQSVVGVDNVCERSAVCVSGGTLAIPKCAGRGVTIAAACKPYHPDWRWQDE